MVANECSGLLAQIRESFQHRTAINLEGPPLTQENLAGVLEQLRYVGGNWTHITMHPDDWLDVAEYDSVGVIDSWPHYGQAPLSAAEAEIGRQLAFWIAEREIVEHIVHRLGRRQPSAKTAARLETARRQHEALRRVWRDLLRERLGLKLRGAAGCR